MLVAQPRLLLVNLHTVGGTLYCFVALALNVPGYGLQHVIKWWSEHSIFVTSFCSTQCQCSMDGGCQPYNVAADFSSFWAQAAGLPNTRRCIIPPAVEQTKWGMALIATFCEDPGSGGTCISRVERSVRIGYMCIPRKWMCYFNRTIIDREVMLAFGGKVCHCLAIVDTHLHHNALQNEYVGKAQRLRILARPAF